MIKRLEGFKNTVNKYIADLDQIDLDQIDLEQIDLRPDRLTTYQSERKLVVSR
jgi:hypothetical protein